MFLDYKNLFVEFRKKRYTSDDLTQVWLDENNKAEKVAHHDKVKLLQKIKLNFNSKILSLKRLTLNPQVST